MTVGTFSRYIIREALGKGGMATVYHAYDPDFDRDVALKILRPELLEDTQQRERFELETKIIAKLEHEAIVPVYDVGRNQDNNQLFYVMRYMAGGSLSDRMQNQPMAPAEIIPIIQRIAPALDHAHDKGIIHRDLKPANILFDQYKHAFISDFGIARFVNSSIRLTKDGIIGTPTYMSPEQAQGDDLDGRSDVYSLGVIVFEMLTGKIPFEATTPLSIAVKHITNPAPRILRIKPDLPAGVDAVIAKVLTKDRDQRYGTAVEFANALGDALKEPPPTIGMPAPMIPVTPPQPKPAPRLRFWMIGGFIALIALSIILIRSFAAANEPLPPAPATATATALTATLTSAPITPAITPTEVIVPPVVNTLPVVIGGADKVALSANNEIYIMNIDGTGIESLTQTRLAKSDLQWLPGRYELLYIESNCVYQIDVATDDREPVKLICFPNDKFTGFRVSPDGQRVAISIADRLLVLPFDVPTLAAVSTAFELQKLEAICLNYTDVTVKDAQWSTDGKRLAIRYQSAVMNRIGDTIRIIEVNWARCQKVPVLVWDDFPGDHFVPEGYERYPLLPSYQWDGGQQFLFNSFIRNKNYGELYLYDLSTTSAKKINPVDHACCYGTAAFSPDGTYMLFVFQDVRLGDKSENRLYYVHMDQIGTATQLTAFRLPSLFPDLRENIQLALHPYP